MTNSELYIKVEREIGKCAFCGRDTSLNKDYKRCDACGAELPKMNRSTFMEVLDYCSKGYNQTIGSYVQSTPTVFGFPVAGFK